MGVGAPRKLFNIQYSEGRVGDGLAKDRLGIGTERRLQLLFRAVRPHKGEVDPHALHGDGEEIEGAAVDGGGGHHMVAAGGDIKDGKEICRLTGGGEHGGGAALQGADLRRHLVVGGILEPGVKITLGLQIEEGPHGLPGGIPEGGGLDNGNVAGLSTPGDVARVEAVGTGLILGHGTSSFQAYGAKYMKISYSGPRALSIKI